MTEDDPTEDDSTDEIATIEARIEELAEVSERCRKIILASKIAIVAGFVLLLLTMLGLFGSGQVTALGSIALILGGIVSFGSNVSTLRQTAEAIGAAERGYIDDVISPHSTRRRLARTLAMLRDKKVEMPAKKHDNLPL